ncbi:hypothetical protein V6N13_020733 [Hibiscus sabdariffa]
MDWYGSIEMDEERLTAEMAFIDSTSAVIKIQRRLPDFLQSVKLKYVKLGYGYSFGSLVVFFHLGLYFAKRSRPVYLLDFACYKPEDDRKLISSRLGLGDETHFPRGITSSPPNLCMVEARAKAVMFGALDSLFEKIGVKSKDVGILIVNCSLFNPAPSFSAMIVNHYKLRTDIKSYNLG